MGDRVTNVIEVGAEPRHVQGHRAAETVADRRNVVRVRRAVLFEQLVGRHEAPLRHIDVGHALVHELHRVFRMVRMPSLAIHVERERRVPKLRQHPRTPANIVALPPPLVYDENTGAWTFLIGVPGQVPH